ncbi:hypothetical protein OQZ33_21565 [Pedobacter sp. MC2016-05]|nr:hypothetical protein [Pedobacter sp. MC2016-05]
MFENTAAIMAKVFVGTPMMISCPTLTGSAIFALDKASNENFY